MAEKFANDFSTTLTAPVTAAALSVPVAAAAPAAIRGGEARLRIDNELLLAVIPADGASPWAVTRGVEGTTAAAHSTGAAVKHVLTAASFLVPIDLAEGRAAARANHTGTQPSSTISDFTESAQDTVAGLLVAGANVTLTYDDVANTLTIAGAASAPADATTTAKGVVQLAGDLAGTAAAPQIAAGVIVDADINAAAAIALSKLATDPLARANHTGAQLAATISDFSTAVPAQITAGAALTKSGGTLDVAVDSASIEVFIDALRVKALGITNGMIANSTVDLSTKVTNALPVGNGGTGQTGAKAARETGVAASGHYSSAVHAAGSTITITAATHGLRATRGIIVQTQDEATGNGRLDDFSVAANGDVVITFSASQPANTIRTTLVG